MERIDIIDAVGREYHTANIENGEFSYPKAFKEKNLDFEPIHKKKGGGSWQFLDIRFELDGVSLLIETKNDADKWPTVEEQIEASYLWRRVRRACLWSCDNEYAYS